MTIESAIQRFCNYQERSHKEVRNKLYELGCNQTEVEQHITNLIEQDLVNEERYARASARGKFRIKGWGRIKIIHHLKQQQISAYCITSGLKEIDQEEYYQRLMSLARRKYEELSGASHKGLKKQKTFRYLLQRGFETSLITEALLEIIQDPSQVSD